MGYCPSPLSPVFVYHQLPILAPDITIGLIAACHEQDADALVSLPVDPRSLAYFHLELLIYLTQIISLRLSLNRCFAAGCRTSTPRPRSACTPDISRMPDLSSSHEASRLPAEQSLCTLNRDSNACFSRITGAPFAIRCLHQPPGACISAAAGARDRTQPLGGRPFPAKCESCLASFSDVLESPLGHPGVGLNTSTRQEKGAMESSY